MSPKTPNPVATAGAKPALVPKLRFPEFRGAAGWEDQPVGQYLEDCSGRVPPDTELPVYSSTREGLKRQDAYFDGQILQNKNEYGVVPPACFVYRHMSDDGLFKFNINETGGDIAVSKEYPVFRTRGLNSVFLLAKLNDGPDFKRFALAQKAGGTRTRLYFSRLCEWRTLLPSPAEQQKIADCLGSLDELIAAQARKVEALKTHKKGLMQQLFPREGETQPRLRFPDFQNAGEWREDTLGSVCDLYQPVTLSSSELSMSGEHLVYGANGVIGTHNEYNHEESEIAVTCRGATCGEVTVTKPRSWITGNAMVVKPRSKTLRKDFIFQYFRNHGLKSVISGSAQPQITRTGFAPLAIFFPYPDEQERIASLLSSLDALISAATQAHEILKTHKQGLMQQLFPSVEDEK